MKILLLGAGPGLSWVGAFLEGATGNPEIGMKPQILVVASPPTRELLLSLVAEPIDALILVDHSPFADGPPPASPSLDVIVRGEAQRAILALELARRAARTLVLERCEVERWPVLLASLLPELLLQPSISQLGGPPSLPLTDLSPAVGVSPVGRLVPAYLAPLFAAVAGGGPISVVWPREFFLDGDSPDTVLPETVEVAGRARILAYGPYLPLPAGSWLATAYLGFSPDIGKLPFILEADTGGAFTRGYFEAERGGIFTLQLDFHVADSLHPIELRLISQDSALEGQAALIEVGLTQSASLALRW